MCFVFIWEQTATCATYSINWLVFITEMKSVYSAVRTGSLNKAVCASYLKGLRIYTCAQLLSLCLRGTCERLQNYDGVHEPWTCAAISGSGCEMNSRIVQDSRKKRQSRVGVCFDRLCIGMSEKNCFQETISTTIWWMKSVSPVCLFKEMLCLWKRRTYCRHFLLCVGTHTHTYTMHAGDETGGNGCHVGWFRRAVRCVAFAISVETLVS